MAGGCLIAVWGQATTETSILQITIRNFYFSGFLLERNQQRVQSMCRTSPSFPFTKNTNGQATLIPPWLHASRLQQLSQQRQQEGTVTVVTPWLI